MINSKQKGKRGERAWRDELRSEGFLKSHRGQQYSGGSESPDVVCPELPGIHFEVKYTQTLDIYGAVLQAQIDAKDSDKLPVVAFKRNHCEWLAIMHKDVFFKMVKDAGYAIPSACPKCESATIKKDGKDAKTFQRYECTACGKRF